MNDPSESAPYSREEIIREYNEASTADEEHQMVKWGSHKSMVNRFKLVMAEVEFSAITRWLDVGCGTGAFQKLVYERVSSAPSCLAIDLSEHLISYARNHVSDQSCSFQTMDFMDLKDDLFGLVTSIGVLQKTNLSPDDFFRKTSELLSSGGTVFVDTKHRGWKQFEQPDFEPEPTHRWFQQSDVIEPAKNAGLNVLETNGFLPRKNKVVPPEESHTIFLIAEKPHE